MMTSLDGACVCAGCGAHHVRQEGGGGHDEGEEEDGQVPHDFSVAYSACAALWRPSDGGERRENDSSWIRGQNGEEALNLPTCRTWQVYERYPYA